MKPTVADSAQLVLGLLLVLFLVPMLFWLTWGIGSSRLQFPTGLPIASLLVRTLALAFLVSSGGVIFAIPLAFTWILAKKLERFVVTAIVLMPLLVGLVARNYAWIGSFTWLRRQGGIGEFLGNHLLYTPFGVGIVMSLLAMPMSFVVLVQTLRTIQPVQIEAAFSLGLDPRSVVTGFFLPAIRRPVVLAALFSICWSSGFFITPRMVGGGGFDLLGNVVVEYANLGRFDYASTVGTLLLALCLPPAIFLVVLSTRLRRRMLGS